MSSKCEALTALVGQVITKVITNLSGKINLNGQVIHITKNYSPKRSSKCFTLTNLNGQVGNEITTNLKGQVGALTANKKKHKKNNYY